MIQCMKHENKCKRKGKKVLSALEEKNLAKRQKISLVDLTDRMREKSDSKKFEIMETA